MTDSNIVRVLVVKLSSLGDIFHALPTVHALKKGLNAEVDWVVQEEYADIVSCFSDVSEVVVFHRRRCLRGFGPFLRSLRAKRYDYIVDLQGLLKSAVITRLARGSRRIGPSFHREGSRLLYDSVAGSRYKARHAVEENMDVLDHLGLDRMKPEFHVAFPKQQVDAPRPRIAILPASRWATKNWPARSFIDFVTQLRRVIEPSLFLIGGAADVGTCQQIEKSIGRNVTNLAGKLSLVETGGLLCEMDLLVSNDSGPMHMAVAVGTPSLVVYGPTDPERTGPYGDMNRIVSAGEECQPCFSRTCRTGGLQCMSGVTPEHVSEIALEMLRKH